MSRHTTPSHRRWSRRAAWLVLPAAATAILTAAPALARTSGTRTASAGYTSATLAPPTALTFTKTCSTSSTVTLRWAATSSAYATGYQLTYTQNGSPATPQTITGRTTVTATYPIANGVTYNATLTATYRNWTSPANPSTGNFLC